MQVSRPLGSWSSDTSCPQALKSSSLQFLHIRCPRLPIHNLIRISPSHPTATATATSPALNIQHAILPQRVVLLKQISQLLQRRPLCLRVEPEHDECFDDEPADVDEVVFPGEVEQADGVDELVERGGGAGEELHDDEVLCPVDEGRDFVRVYICQWVHRGVR